MPSVRVLMVQHLNELNKDENWFPEVCGLIADGMTSYEIAVKHEVFSGVFRTWIAADDKREEMFNKAEELREKLRKETLKKHVYDMATTEPGKVTVTENGKLRAAEMLLNPKIGGVSVSSDGGKITIVHESQ